MPSATRVLSAAQLLKRPLLLVVDGYNECNEAAWDALSLEVTAWTRRYNAGLLITSRVAPLRVDLLELRTIQVLPATSATKTAIAMNVMSVNELPEELKPLLDAVTTGLEARLVGQVGQGFPPGRKPIRPCSTSILARACKATPASAFSPLSRLAGWLVDTLTFSLTIRDFERPSGR